MKSKLKVIKGGDKPLKRKKLSQTEISLLIDFEQKGSPKKHLQSLLSIADDIEDITLIYTNKKTNKLIIKSSDNIGLWSQIGWMQIAIQCCIDDARGK